MTTHDASSTPTTDRHQILDKIEEQIGALNDAQRQDVLAAIDEEPAGALALARRVAANPRVVRAAAVYLSNIAKGEHRPRRDPRAKSERLPAIETAQRLFAAKLVELERLTDWPQPRRVEAAIDYAIGEAPRISTALPAGISFVDVENELRRRVGAIGRVTRVETPEQAIERRRDLGRQWQRINACRHDPRISSMFRALRDQCADPENPTDDEGEATRLALIAEIEHLGVEARGFGVLLPDISASREAELAKIDAEDLPW